jgi:pyruvate dehydrogenase E1 component beta subunit
VQVCRQACDALAQEGIEVDLIDLRTLWPWDRQTVLESCARTGHLLVAHEAIQVAGFGAEIVATVAQELSIPVRRLGAPRIPVGYAPVLEAQARISVEATVQAARRVLGR